MDINNPQSPTHSESKLKFALCQIYGLQINKGINKNTKAGLEAIFDVWLAGGKQNRRAFELLSPSTFVDDIAAIKRIVATYNAIPQNERDAKTNVILGILSLKGIGINLNAPIAFGCLKKAADEQNFPAAQLLVGEIHFLGCRRAGISDPKTASDWLIAKDPAIAISYLRKSAKQFPRAQSALGTCYLEGKKVQKDLSEAVFWLSKAYENGMEDVLPKLKRARLELEKELELFGFGKEQNLDNPDKKKFELEKEINLALEEDLDNFDQGIFTQKSEKSPEKNTFKRNTTLMFSNNGNNAAQATINNRNSNNNNRNSSNTSKKYKYEEGVTLYRATNINNLFS